MAPDFVVARWQPEHAPAIVRQHRLVIARQIDTVARAAVVDHLQHAVTIRGRRVERSHVDDHVVLIGGGPLQPQREAHIRVAICRCDQGVVGRPPFAVKRTGTGVLARQIDITGGRGPAAEALVGPHRRVGIQRVEHVAAGAGHPVEGVQVPLADVVLGRHGDEGPVVRVVAVALLEDDIARGRDAGQADPFLVALALVLAVVHGVLGSRDVDHRARVAGVRATGGQRRGIDHVVGRGEQEFVEILVNFPVVEMAFHQDRVEVPGRVQPGVDIRRGDEQAQRLAVAVMGRVPRRDAGQFGDLRRGERSAGDQQAGGGERHRVDDRLAREHILEAGDVDALRAVVARVEVDIGDHRAALAVVAHDRCHLVHGGDLAVDIDRLVLVEDQQRLIAIRQVRLDGVAQPVAVAVLLAVRALAPHVGHRHIDLDRVAAAEAAVGQK